MLVGFEVVVSSRTAKDFSDAERDKLADSGAAEADGSFPITDAKDLSNAKHDLGRAGDKPSDREHINERAKALGLPGLGEGKESKTAEHDDSYGDDWSDIDWQNYAAGFDQGAAGHPLGFDTGDDGSGHGQPFQDGHYDGTLIGWHGNTSTRKTATGTCPHCGAGGIEPGAGRCPGCDYQLRWDIMDFDGDPVEAYDDGLVNTSRKTAIDNWDAIMQSPEMKAAWPQLRNVASDLLSVRYPGDGIGSSDINHTIFGYAQSHWDGSHLDLPGLFNEMADDADGARPGNEPKRYSSKHTAANETGYFVVSRNGSHLSGPYATMSEAAPFMIEQRGATVQFQGPGDSDVWAATKAKTFPVNMNTVNGSKKTAADVNYNAGPDDPGIDFDYYDPGHKAVYNGFGTDGTCEVCGKAVLFSGFGPGDHMDPNTEVLWKHVRRAAASKESSRSYSWDTEEDPWAGPRTAARKTAGFATRGSMQERYATGRRLASLRHFADDDDQDSGPFAPDVVDTDAGLENVDAGDPVPSAVQVPNSIAGQDLERIPANLLEAMRMTGYDVDPDYPHISGSPCPECILATDGSHHPDCPYVDDYYKNYGPGDPNAYVPEFGAQSARKQDLKDAHTVGLHDGRNVSDCPTCRQWDNADAPHDQLDDPWNQQPSAGEY
jgi:hypothetical protein